MSRNERFMVGRGGERRRGGVGGVRGRERYRVTEVIGRVSPFCGRGGGRMRGRVAGGGKEGRVRQSVLYGDVLQVLQAVAGTKSTLYSDFT